MKPRTPKSFAGAVTKIMMALSDDLCATLVGRSDSLVRKWADPDHPSLPTLNQAIILDAAYVQGGFGSSPILAVYEDMLETALNGAEDEPADLLLTALSIQSVVGDLSEVIRTSLDPKNPHGPAVAPRDRQAILELIHRLEEHTDDIEDAVEPRH